ncbi:MAG: hypothetical protein IKW74_06250 [Thermoguttaceae bacterium]|nr:hypothetical protein [Thermoguttaceae bacterium]
MFVKAGVYKNTKTDIAKDPKRFFGGFQEGMFSELKLARKSFASCFG